MGKTSFFQEINLLLSGQLTEDDESAVDEEFAAILADELGDKVADEMPEVPTENPEVEPVEGNCIINESMYVIKYLWIFRKKQTKKSWK